MTAGALDGVIASARQRAAANRHAFVGTEHLLAALLDDPASLTTTLVTRTGLAPADLSRSLLDGLRQAGDGDAPSPESVPLSSFAQRAVEGAADESELLRRLISNPKGRIAQALRADPKAIVAIKTALGLEKPAPKEPAQSTKPARERKPPTPRAEPRAEAKQRPAKPSAPDRAPDRGPDRVPDRSAERPAATPPAAAERPLRLAVRPHTERRPFPWSRLLLVAVPISMLLAAMHAPPVVVFFGACLAVLPLAQLMGNATESLADRFGPTAGGLLNATFGNAAELIIAIAALNAGLVDLVKASITGSILGNLLLILGLSFIAGGGKHAVVRFNRNNAGMSAAMLALAVVGLLFPAIFHAVHDAPIAELRLSEIVAGILIITYLFSLLFSLRTHRALFGGGDHPDVEPIWGQWTSILILGVATIGVVIESEILVHSVQSVTASLGWSQTFLGLVIIPLIGNAAEHATAVVAARKGQTDLAFQIALGSSTQVALVVAPLLVFVGLAIGTGLNLVFHVFEVAALAVSTIVIAIITLDGETHWFEGVQLLALYGMMAAAAFFI